MTTFFVPFSNSVRTRCSHRWETVSSWWIRRHSISSTAHGWLWYVFASNSRRHRKPVQWSMYLFRVSRIRIDCVRIATGIYAVVLATDRCILRQWIRWYCVSDRNPSLCQSLPKCEEKSREKEIEIWFQSSSRQGHLIYTLSEICFRRTQCNNSLAHSFRSLSSKCSQSTKRSNMISSSAAFSSTLMTCLKFAKSILRIW